MQFEHLLAVNGPDEPVMLNREELWFGLLCRVEDARPFLPGLESCRIVERRPDELVRELHFGSTVIRDRVRLSALDWVRFETETMQEHVGGSLTIHIVEDEAGVFFLRFRYETNLPEHTDEETKYASIVRSAYYRSDIDTLQAIRVIARSGRPQ
ncbi:MAG: DUF1857 family protein [Azoarcus sp.]|nr:DUF1857 family protein [Azoarcus sp.]